MQPVTTVSAASAGHAQPRDALGELARGVAAAGSRAGPGGRPRAGQRARGAGYLRPSAKTFGAMNGTPVGGVSVLRSPKPVTSRKTGPATEPPK